VQALTSKDANYPPPVTTSGCVLFLGASHVGMFIGLSPQWSDLLPIKTKLFHSGPPSAHCIPVVERSRKVAKVLRTCVVQVQRKFRSDNVHVAPLETAGIFNVEMIHIAGKCHTGHGVALPGCGGGLSLGGRPCWLSVSLCW